MTKYELENAIADHIVATVERAGRPVTLARIEKEIRGFARLEPGAPSWSYEVGDNEVSILWNGMTAEGCEALRAVLRDGRVAMCPSHRVSYLLEGRCPSEENWVPIALAPAAMANVQGRGWLFSTPPQVADQIMRRAEAEADRDRWHRLDLAS